MLFDDIFSGQSAKTGYIWMDLEACTNWMKINSNTGCISSKTMM